MYRGVASQIIAKGIIHQHERARFPNRRSRSCPQSSHALWRVGSDRGAGPSHLVNQWGAHCSAV